MNGLALPEKKQRILILEPAGNMWGSERVLMDFLQCASNSLWNIAICCPPNSPILPRLSRLSVQIFPTFIAELHTKRRSQRLLAAINLLKATMRFRAQLIYVNQAGATRIALAVGRLLGLPVVTHVRLVEDVPYVQSLQVSVKKLPKVICISQHIFKMFGELNDSKRNQVVMLYDPYSPRNNWNSTAMLPDYSATPIFSCVGRLAQTKGQDVLLRAVAILKSEGCNVKVLFIGADALDDGFGSELKRVANGLGIADRVVWLGYQEEVFSYITACVAQVCPSHSEALGRVVFEAWDAGVLPIAWAGSGGSAEVIRSSGGGLLYDHQEGESLAKALKDALSMSVAARIELIERGRAWLRANCDTPLFTANLLNIWQAALSAR